MNDVDELKRYTLVHARGQGIPAARYQAVLDRISTDGTGPGSWVGEWSRTAEELARRGAALDASRCFGMARFPFVDGAHRETAARRAIELFDAWRPAAIRPLEVGVNGGRVRCWTSGLSATRRRPLLLIMGGIVTPKEQWGPVLTGIGRLGMAGVVTEMPGVGENTVPYGGKSWQMIPAILDELGPLADTSHTYAMALSFAGHLALRCAAEDHRIRGVVTVGAPVRRFFTDRGWQDALPRITRDCLTHLTGAPLPGPLPELALTAEQLSTMDIPVHYLSCARDEIIPPGEPAELSVLPDLHLVENDDVHGSPAHTEETRLWAIRSVLRSRRARPVTTATLSALLAMARARSGRRR